MSIFTTFQHIEDKLMSYITNRNMSISASDARYYRRFLRLYNFNIIVVLLIMCRYSTAISFLLINCDQSSVWNVPKEAGGKFLSIQFSAGNSPAYTEPSNGSYIMYKNEKWCPFDVGSFDENPLAGALNVKFMIRIIRRQSAGLASLSRIGWRQIVATFNLRNVMLTPYRSSPSYRACLDLCSFEVPNGETVLCKHRRKMNINHELSAKKPNSHRKLELESQIEGYSSISKFNNVCFFIQKLIRFSIRQRVYVALPPNGES